MIPRYFEYATYCDRALTMGREPKDYWSFMDKQVP